LSETEVVEIASHDVGDRNRVRTDAITALDTPQFDKKRNEIFPANVLEHGVGEDEVNRSRRDALEGFQAVTKVPTVTGLQNAVEIEAQR
jgi:hypothetical protein